MEVVLFGVLGLTFALLIYTIVWTSAEIRKKGQHIVDSFFDGLFVLVRWKVRKPSRKSGHSTRG
jgi:hypothetical protein